MSEDEAPAIANLREFLSDTTGIVASKPNALEKLSKGLLNYLVSAHLVTDSKECKSAFKLLAASIKFSSGKGAYKQVLDQIAELETTASRISEENQRLKTEIGSLQSQISNYEVDMKSLSICISDMADQLSEQATELSECHLQRSSLVSALQRADKIAGSAIRFADSISDNLNKCQAQNEFIKNEIRSKKDEEKDNKFISSCVAYFPSSVRPSAMKIAIECQASPETLIPRLFSLVGQPQKAAEEKQSKILMDELFGVLSFIESISNSADFFESIGRNSRFEDLKPILQSEAMRVNNFLRENKCYCTKDESIFGKLIRSDPLKLNENLSSFLNRFSEPKTEECSEILSILSESLYANDLLRSFLERSNRQIADQKEIIKREQSNLSFSNEESLKNIEQLRLQFECEKKALNKSIESINSSRAKADEEIKAIRCFLREKALEDDNSEIWNALKCFKDADYSSRLEEKIKLLKKKLEMETASNAESLKTLKTNVSNFETQSKSMVSKINLLQKECDDLKLQLKNVYIDFEVCKKEKQSLLLTVESIKEKSSKIAEEKEIQFSETVAILKKNVAELTDSMLKERNKFENSSERVVNAFQKRIKKLTCQVASEAKELEMIESKYLIELSALRDKESELNSINCKLQSSIKSADAQIISLSAELKASRAAEASKSEKLKQTQLSLDGAITAKVIAVESEAEMGRNSTEIENQKKIMMIYSILRGFSDPSLPLNAFIESIRNRIEELENQNDNNVSIIRAIRQLLFLKENESIEDGIKSMICTAEKVARLETEAKAMEKEVESARCIVKRESDCKDWEAWAKHLYLLVSDGVVLLRKPSEVRFALEEALLTSLGDRTVWRNNSLLRIEKSLLLSGISNEKASGEPSLRQIAIGISFLRRICRWIVPTQLKKENMPIQAFNGPIVPLEKARCLKRNAIRI